MKRQEFFKITQDDFHPNFEGNKVKLIYHGKLPTANVYRVSLWGNDDYALYQDYIKNVRATRDFNYLKSLDVLNKADAYKLGFENY